MPDEAARADLWRSGSPVQTWSGAARPAGLDEQAERLAAFRGQAFAGYER